MGCVLYTEHGRREPLCGCIHGRPPPSAPLVSSHTLAHLLLSNDVDMSVSPAERPDPGSGAAASFPRSCIDAFDRELDYVFATLRRLGAPAPDVEDLAQEIFIVLHKNWATIDVTRPLRPYLFGVAFRVCRAHRRRGRREIALETFEVEDASADPEMAARNVEATTILMSALDHVPFDRRAVLVMHELDGVPVAEIATRLSMSRFGVYARLRKGRRELQSAIRRVFARTSC